MQFDGFLNLFLILELFFYYSFQIMAILRNKSRAVNQK